MTEIDVMQYENIKLFMVAIFMLLLCLFVAVNFGLSRDDIVGRILNKINVGRFATRHHEGVLTYTGERPLTIDTPPAELAVFLTSQLGVVLTPADFKYVKIEIKDTRIQLSVVMSRRCSVFYGKASFLVNVPTVRIPTSSLILITELGGLLTP